MTSEKGRRRKTPKGVARRCAMEALYQMEMGNQGVESVIAQYGQFPRGAHDHTFFAGLVRGVVKEQSGIDTAIKAHLRPEWRFSRLNAVLRALLRCVYYEIRFHADEPLARLIAQYADMAGSYVERTEVDFVQAMMDSYGKKLRHSADP